MRKLTDEEIQIVGGGNPIAAAAIVGAVASGGSAYLSGGSPGSIAGASLMGAASGGYGAVATIATGVGRAVYTGYSVATAMATGLFTRSASSA